MGQASRRLKASADQERARPRVHRLHRMVERCTRPDRRVWRRITLTSRVALTSPMPFAQYERPCSQYLLHEIRGVTLPHLVRSSDMTSDCGSVDCLPGFRFRCIQQ